MQQIFKLSQNLPTPTRATKIPKPLLDEFKKNSGESYVSTVNKIITKYNRISDLLPEVSSLKQQLESDSGFLLGNQESRVIDGKEYIFLKTPDHYAPGDQFSHPGVDVFVKSNGLSKEFYKKLDQISKQTNIDVKDLLTVFYGESGINTNRIGYLKDKSGNLVIFGGGLNQMTHSILPNYFDGTIKDYTSLPPEKQLDCVGKFFIKANPNRHKLTPELIYIKNFLPGALSRPVEGKKITSGDPSGIIAQENGTFVYPGGLSESLIYRDNAGLDIDQDHKITLGDIKRFVDGRSNSSAVRSTYRNYMSHAGRQEPATQSKNKISKDYLLSVQKELDDLLSKL